MGTHSVSVETYAWKTCTRVRWALIVSLTSSWIIATRGALRAYVCRVVRFIPLQGWLLIQISATSRIWVMACSSHLNVVILPSWCYLYHEMDVDYLVVEVMINISKLFDYTCMLRIWCKPMMLITSICLITCLKIFKASWCRLMYHLSLEAFACLEVWLLGHDGPVLLSVVVKALLCNFLCAVPLFFSLSMNLLMAVSGKRRLLCAGFRTEAHHRRRIAKGGLHP
jgi:hypothetical protein